MQSACTGRLFLLASWVLAPAVLFFEHAGGSGPELGSLWGSVQSISGKVGGQGSAGIERERCYCGGCSEQEESSMQQRTLTAKDRTDAMRQFLESQKVRNIEDFQTGATGRKQIRATGSRQSGTESDS
ncbi:hypothetical protein NDU88_002853 [Pleurodeles waltl]|uniref:Uncharacterized protein n=1 Tax=Pleurodeles waltl TaxID=8319 RepID=A0AAV7W3L1_PLEWA|nr:hypothetical protein NDU88_002853 [Pleurodeles waltl]